MIFKVEIRGVVQGVGFRPFIYNLATSMELNGYVSNNAHGVIIVVDTTKDKVDEFVEQIRAKRPPLSDIESIDISPSNEKQTFKDFTIKKSESSDELTSMIPSDIAMCKECQEELEDKNNRRYNYPFITCTNCGPRYSIIKNLPYDRKNTSMAEFEMCKKCQDEYKNPKDRRYHAQPIGCFECGPMISLLDKSGKKQKIENVVDEVVKFIADGKIVAIKGVGGYHLVCDARNEKAVKLLRERKQRPSKPFAVMVKDINMSKEIVHINAKEEELLSSNRRPVVLLGKNERELLCDSVAPNINQLGLFLAYTPLHHMILQKLNCPLVATSANISGEPLCINSEEIMKLSHIWDYCLDHDREIVNSCDDSVLFVENEKIFMLRCARGYSPTYLKLPNKTDKKILSLGANQKSTVAITIENKVIISPYIADLEGLSSIEHFKSHIETLKRIYDFEPDVVVCDKHPRYESTKYAKELKEKNSHVELMQVQHHYAHILSTMGLNNITSKVLGVSFDGTGYGKEGHLWGGEFFVCDEKGYERVGHFKYFKLLGGEMAIKEPRRVALSFLFELYGEDVLTLNNHTTASFTQSELKVLYQAWKKGLNSPLSSSCGRFFDAVASILDILHVSSHEGESGLLLESLYDENIKDFYEFSILEKEIDFSVIFYQILKEEDKTIAVSKFFNTLVEIIFDMSKKHDLPVVLGGGVFQNRVLLRLIMKIIPDVTVPSGFVSNDSAIAYGQAIAAASR
ncbi:carbamoyltransferase HypF [Sulfurimonas sp.]|uniref:carbamoyltransferase HypF n=1 Tax=Sulfurimonas sp. TaxID=2022749 RepID=UPI002639F411|nr:carbamoyltransferase HypF [Sulfurimonas sp.]MCW8894353.1 carbamoyltransferase HypF [Sulfurimonas sp.]MCW9067370.1 carbamoyltransferase HypF [Sulfurimonas sp.]